MKHPELIARLTVALGSAALVASFFLPLEFDRRPFVQVANFAEPLRQVESIDWDFFFNAGVVTLLSSPYLWAALVAIGALAGRRTERFFAWLTTLLQTAGFLVVSGIACSLIRMEDTWMSPKAMWSAFLVPLVLVAGTWLIFFLSSATRRFYALVLFPMIPYAALNLIMAKSVVKYEGDPAGFLAGGVGALLAAAAAIVVMILRKPDASQAGLSGSAVPPDPAD